MQPIVEQIKKKFTAAFLYFVLVLLPIWMRALLSYSTLSQGDHKTASYRNIWPHFAVTEYVIPPHEWFQSKSISSRATRARDWLDLTSCPWLSLLLIMFFIWDIYIHTYLFTGQYWNERCNIYLNTDWSREFLWLVKCDGIKQHDVLKLNVGEKRQQD